jgi:hypothetical protein
MSARLLAVFIWVFLLILFSSWSALFGQTVLIERDVRVDTQQSTIGPNRKMHFQLMVGLGNFFGGGHPNVPIRYGNSREFFIAFQYKRKLTSQWSTGLDVSFRNMVYRIDQNPGRKRIPDTLVYDRERFSLPQFAVQPWFRFNFDRRRGDRTGIYLDASTGLHVPFSQRRVMVYTTADADHLLKVVERKLDYLVPVFMTFALRAGYQRFSVYGQWRLTPLFKPETSRRRWEQTADLPPFLLGLQVAFY